MSNENVKCKFCIKEKVKPDEMNFKPIFTKNNHDYDQITGIMYCDWHGIVSVEE